jgi:hypothetical protein
MARDQTAFALAGVGGMNAHGVGFLAAAQELARARAAARPDFAPAGAGNGRRELQQRPVLEELEFISCTSGMIAWTALYLRGVDLRAALEAQIAEVDRALPLPRNELYAPWRAPLVALLTGLPGIFRPLRVAYARHFGERLSGFLDPHSPWFGALPTTWTELWDLWLPARLFIPTRPRRFFEELAATFEAEDRLGIAFNSYKPQSGDEYLYVNQRGLQLIREHYDKHAAYDRRRGTSPTIYRRIDVEGIRAALWLLEYGFRETFDGEHLFDGAYARSVIVSPPAPVHRTPW